MTSCRTKEKNERDPVPDTVRARLVDFLASAIRTSAQPYTSHRRPQCPAAVCALFLRTQVYAGRNYTARFDVFDIAIVSGVAPSAFNSVACCRHVLRKPFPPVELWSKLSVTY